MPTLVGCYLGIFISAEVAFGSEVQIGDKYLGHTNGKELTLELPVGDHNVMFRQQGFQNWERSIAVRHNDCYTVKATHDRA